MHNEIDDIKERLAAWQEEPRNGGGLASGWPGGAGDCAFCDQKIAEASDDPMAVFSRPMIVCPECGNKRCPKAAWHHNECTRSNEPRQPTRYPHPFSPEDVAYLIAQIGA